MVRKFLFHFISQDVHYLIVFSYHLVDSRSIYPLLSIYGASSATTTYACLATVLTMPGISQPHLVKLLASYVPFLLVPLMMAVDFGLRLTSSIAEKEDRIVRNENKLKTK